MSIDLSKLTPAFRDRFSIEDSRCWPWVGMKDKKGYGIFHLG